MGATTLSATLGGSLLIDGRKIRLIPYDGGTGNVPAYNTTISGAAGSGLLIGVYDTLSSTPTAVGAAMPADGYIKIKQWNDGAFVDNEALTGIGATVTTDPIFGGTDRVGWLEYVQQESTSFTLSRLNNPSNNITIGDWYMIGTTDGVRATTYQIPTNGVNQYHGGVWVEGAASVNITDIDYDTTYKTFDVTATSHGMESGDKVTIAGVTPSAYNGTYFCRKIDANTLRFFYDDWETAEPGTYSSGGTVAGEWEFYPNTSDDMTIANFETSALKGKWCKIATTGVLRFGHDGTNSTGGYIPPSGRGIRIGNVFMTGATSAAKTQNSYNATPASRPRFITSGAARAVMSYTSFNWGFASMTTVAVLEMTNCAVNGGMTISTPASAPTFVNCGFGNHIAEATTRLTISNASAGTVFTDCVISVVGQGASTPYPYNPTDCLDVVATRTKFIFSGPRGAAAQFSLQLTRSDRLTFTQCVFGHGMQFTTSSNAEVRGGYYYDSTNGKNIVANSMYGFTCASLASDILIEGLFIDSGDLPRSGMVSSATSSANITLRNIGRMDAIVGTGLYEEDGASWSRVTTTATVTTASAHGLTTGDSITVWRSDNVAAIPRGEFVVTVTGATTFTFTCTNSGSTSGVLSYYTAQMARIFLTATSTSNLKVQNVHLGPCRTAQYGMENASGNITVENCTTGYYDDSADVITNNDLHFRGSSLSALTNTAQSSVYGTHIVSGYVAPIGVAGSTAKNWARSSATITVTHTNHGLYTGQRIQVLYTDSWDAVATAAGVTAQTVTVLTKDTFAITGTNAGAASGTLDYITHDGMMMLLMNEPTTASDAQFNVVAGTPLFTGAGALTMPTVGDTVEFVTETWITDFDSIPNMLPYMTGSPDPKNFKITYALDTGSGYSAFKNYAYFRAGSGGSSASTTVTMTDTTGVAVNDYVYGEGIANGAKVVSIDSGTAITVSIANTATVAGTGLWFNQAPNESAFPTTGFKMKVRIETMTTNTDGLIFIRLPFVSDATSRAVLYPQIELPTQSVTITGATAGSRIQLYDLTSSTELYNGTPTFPYTWTDTEQYVADREIRLRVSYVSGTSAKEYIQTTIGTATQDSPDLTYLVTQEDDVVYNTNAVNGSTVTGITISSTRYSLTASKTCAQIYAFAMYTAFTETGIRDYGLAMTAVDTANYLLDEVLFKNTSSPTAAVSITGGWVRDFDTGVAIDLVDTTGGTLFMAPDHVVAYGSTLTEADLDDIRLTNVLVKDSLS